MKKQSPLSHTQALFTHNTMNYSSLPKQYAFSQCRGLSKKVVCSFEFRSQNAIAFDQFTYNQMRKKESQTHPHNPPSTKLFIISAAFKNYERDRIDSIAINNFNHLLHSITLKIMKNSNEPEVVELFKVTNELVIGFLANLSEQTYRHTCTHQDIVHLFITLANYFEKAVNAFGMGDAVIQSCLLKIFWPVFSKSQDASKGMDHSKVDLINNLIPNIEGPKSEKINFSVFLRESYTVLGESGKKELGIREILISFLRNSSVVSNFKPTLLKYLNISIVQNLEEHFKNALLIYQNIGSTFEERRLNLESVLLKTLDYNNCISFLVVMNNCMNLTKLISPANLPAIVFKITQKLFSKINISSNSLKILEELSQITIVDLPEASCQKFFGKGENLISRFLEWVFTIYVKRDDNDNNLQIQAMFKEEAEFKEEKILEFVKNLSNNGDRSDELKKVCQHFSRFINNMCKHPNFKEKIIIKDLDSIAVLKNSCSNEVIKDFILNIIPPLVGELNFSIKDKSSLKCSIMLKAAQLQAHKSQQSLQSLTPKFKEIFFQMLQEESLNFHYIICFIFLKYEKEREGIRDILLDSIITDLEKEGVNRSSRNLIINLSLFLKSYDNLLMSQPIKYKVRQLIKNNDFVVNKLDISQILGVQPKEYVNLTNHNIEFDSKAHKLKRLLNKELSNYSCKEHMNIFYSLVIAVNDVIQLPNQEHVQNSLLTQITSLRKRAMLGETCTNIHLLNEALKDILSNYSFTHPKKIQIFLLILRLNHLTKATSIKSSQDSQQLYPLLSDFLVLANASLDGDLLQKIQSFRSNPCNYSYESYISYIQDRQIIKFYSQSSQDLYKTHIVLCRVILTLLGKLVEMKEIKLQSLSNKLQIMFLLYSTGENAVKYGFTREHEEKIKNYIMILLLQKKIENNLAIEPLIKKLMPYAGSVKEIAIQKHMSQYIVPFKEIYPIDFFGICLTAIRKTLDKDQKDSRALFDFVNKVISEDQKHCSCLLKSLMNKLECELSETVCHQIFNRVKRGLDLENKTQFLERSSPLYKLISKSLTKDKSHLLGLVQELVQLDCYSDSEKSAFILKQISNIFTYVEERNSQICETIFNYILTLTQIFGGEQKLEISTFICHFFGLTVTSQHELNLNAIEKSISLTCTASPNYKCLQCDEKKIICLGCSLTCHENHPVCFLNIPPELKFSKCLCSEINCNSCKFNNKDQANKASVFIKPKDFPAYKPMTGLMGAPPEIYQRMKVLGNPFPSRYARGEQVFEDTLSRLEMQSFLREEELIEQEMRANQWYQNIRRGDRDRDRQRDRQRDRDREEFIGRLGGARLQKIIDREDYPGSYRMFIDANEGRRGSRPQPEKNREKEESFKEVVESEFVDENYEVEKIQQQKKVELQSEESNTILKKYVLLPKFIDLMVNFCNKKSDKSKALTSIEYWKLNFSNPQISKLPQGHSFKLHNPGSFTFQIRKQNAIHNMSCVLIKKTVAHNHKFVLLASSTELSVFSKEKLLSCLPQMKTIPGFNNLSRHSIAFEVHSLDFSPVDQGVFCASGLHNLILLNLSNQGHISRTSFRYNVSNFYINKIKLTKMGIFLGIDKEIRVLNYSCRHFLTLRAQESHTIIRQWAIFQKAAGCQILFVCPNGNIFTTDVLPSDEDKKEFVCRVADHRVNKTGTGASISASDLPDFGKYLFASFKDGSNILGHLQSDQLEDMVNMQLKGLKYQKNIFDTFFIIGHAEIIKMPQSQELFLICTVKKYFPPEMSFHQGFLIVIKFKKEADKKESTSQIIVINDQALCESFHVIRVGKKNFFIYSVHNDGSVQITALNKLSRQNIEDEIISIKENEDLDNQLDLGDSKTSENINNIRKNISKQIKLDLLVKDETVSSMYAFRQGTEVLKTGSDYSLIKHSETDYQLRYNNYSKIITGFSVPYFGEVSLPSRSVKSSFQIGFTSLEALYFFSEGSFKFKYKYNENQRYARQAFFSPNANPRMLEKIERLSEYQQGEKLFNSHIMNSLMGFKEDTNDIQFIGKPFDLFKSKISKFQDFFKADSDDQSSSIEKTALIIKMFLTKSLKEGNPCSDKELIHLIEGIKSITASSSKRLFNLLKEIIVLASQVYQKLIGKEFAVSEESYPLRIATESRLEHFFNTLKIDISDNQLNEFLSFMLSILQEDENLMAYYVSKYSGVFAQLHKRIKKADTEERAKSLIELYTFAYPVLKFCGIPCSWILVCICSITFSFNTSKSVRDTLYEGIKRSKNISFQEYLKKICSSDGMIEEEEVLLNRPKEPQDEPKDQMTQIYSMFNRGEIDEETLFKMITEASKLDYERQQQNQMALEEQFKEVQPELQKEMEAEQNIVNHNIALVQDLIDQCTDSLNENLEVTYSRVLTLYVLSKAVDHYFQDSTDHLLKRIKKMVSEIDLKVEGDKLNSVLSYACLFERVLNSSSYLKKNAGKQYPLYLEIEEQVNQKLANVRLESVPKISRQPNLLGKVFRNQRGHFSIHIAYALTCFLLFPCEASHVLLSLECYWLLPESKQFYSKKKDFSNITDGIQSGNISKVHEIAKECPQIWQEYNNISSKLQFVEKWIEEKKQNWQLALQLLAIYYQD